MSNSEEHITALSLAYQLDNIYVAFTDSIRSMGKKHSGKSRLGSSVVHWLAGSHVRTERDVLCDQFLTDVKKHLELFQYALEGESEEQIQEACGVLADIMTQPQDAKANNTTSLMKRAMVRELMPFLSKLSKEKLTEIKQRMESNYRKSDRLPVERDLLKQIDQLL